MATYVQVAGENCFNCNARHSDSHPARVSTPKSSRGARTRQSELDSRNLVGVS